MGQIYSFVIWQSSMIGLYWVALQTVSMETVRCRTFLFSEVAKFKYPTKTETLFIKIELSEVKENLWRSYLKRRATTSNSVQIQNLSLSFALEGFCMLVDLCINKLLKGCSSVSVDISFSLKKNYYSSHSPCYFSEKKKKLAAVNARSFIKGSRCLTPNLHIMWKFRFSSAWVFSAISVWRWHDFTYLTWVSCLLSV